MPQILRSKGISKRFSYLLLTGTLAISEPGPAEDVSAFFSHHSK